MRIDRYDGPEAVLWHEGHLIPGEPDSEITATRLALAKRATALPATYQRPILPQEPFASVSRRMLAELRDA